MLHGTHKEQFGWQVFHAECQASSGRDTATAAAGSLGLRIPVRAAAGRVARCAGLELGGFGTPKTSPKGMESKPTIVVKMRLLPEKKTSWSKDA